MPYTPPNGGSVNLDFVPSYTPPNGGSVQLDFAGASLTQTIFPSGFSIGAVSAPVLSGTAQTISALGLSLFAMYPAPFVRGPQYVAPGGLNLNSPGLPILESRGLWYEGLDLFSLGPTTFVDRDPRTVSPNGWSVLEFNYTEMDVGHDIRYRTVPGFSTLAFGTQSVKTRATTLDDLLSFGTPRVENFRRYLTPTGMIVGAFGTQWVSNKRRYLQPTGFEPLIVTKPLPGGLYGTYEPRVERKNRTINGNTMSLIQYGSQMVGYGKRYLLPVGFETLSEVWSEFDLPGAGVRLKAGGSIQPSGVNLLEFGDVQQAGPKRVYTSGFSTLAFGELGVRRRSYIAPTGLSLTAIGDPAPVVPGTVYRVTAGDELAFGRVVVRPAATTAGFDSLQFGDTHTARAIKPAGLNLSVVAGQGVNNEYWCNMWIGANLTAGSGLVFGTANVHR